jgi:hypothetical protein
MSGLREITEHGAQAALVQELIGRAECDQLTSDCALLRTVAWALTGGNRPIHILRLLNLASSYDSNSEASRARFKECLDELAEAGDLAELANGRWLPAPTREVVLATNDDTRLLVGGLPTSALPAKLKLEIDHSGAYRRVKGERLVKELALPRESRANWLGESPARLEEWTEQALEGRYEAYRDEGRSLFVYAPELFPQSSLQLKRWVERTHKLSGRYLGRQELPFGMRRHYAVEVTSGKVSRLMNLRQVDLRRLQYGLDLRAGKSLGIEEQKRWDSISLILKNELPRPERRYLAALGRLTVPEEGYYPRTWSIPIQYAADVRARLNALGIVIVSKANR